MKCTVCCSFCKPKEFSLPLMIKASCPLVMFVLIGNNLSLVLTILFSANFMYSILSNDRSIEIIVMINPL